MNRQKRYISIVMIVLIFSPLFLTMAPYDSFAADPPKVQKSSAKVVEAQPRRADPGVYWYQQDNGSFRADYKGTFSLVPNAGSCENPYPTPTEIPDDVNLSSWPASSWVGDYPSSQVSNVRLKGVTWITNEGSFTPVGNPVIKSATIAEFRTITGGSNHSTDERYGTRPNGCDKLLLMYLTPVNIIWEGEVFEEKEIRVNSAATLAVNATRQMTADVRTKAYGSASFGNYLPVTTGLTWTSSAPSIATVSSSGLVTAKAAGTASIRATWTGTNAEGFTYTISDAAVITVTSGGPGPTPTPTPTPASVTGDFDILPGDTINWRDTFSLKPKNITVSSGCTYSYHEYRIAQGGSSWTSPKVYGMTTTTSFSYSNYPWVMAVGSHDITIRVTAACGDSGWTASKSLYINGPEDNRSPVFSVGFFKENNRYGFDPDFEVVVNAFVNLRVINDPRHDPAWPYDPDGDPITYTWDFTGSDSAWIRSLPNEYGVWEHDEGHYNLRATTLGYHRINVSARDPFGGVSTRMATINVVPENPIPRITGPASVVEGRPLPTPFSASGSYSPAGRTIAQYIWTNKREVYPSVGTETITLEVVDSAGVASLAKDKAIHSLVVVPDLPPTPQLDFLATALRGIDVPFTNNSFSPDNDVLIKNEITMWYDANNNGVRDASEALTPVTVAPDRTFSYKPTKVGTYTFIVDLEDWGRTATQAYTFEVVNENPEASFSVVGEVPQAPEINRTTVTPSQILYDANWLASNPKSASAFKFYQYNAEENAIETPRMQGSNYYETFMGQDPYLSITGSVISTHLARHWTTEDGTASSPFLFRKQLVPGIFYMDKFQRSFFDVDGTAHNMQMKYRTALRRGRDINPHLNLTFGRDSLYNDWYNYYTITEEMHRITDIVSALRNNTPLTPFYGKTYTNHPVAEPPLPAAYQYAPVKLSSSATIPTIYAGTAGNYTNNANVTADNFGNPYRYYRTGTIYNSGEMYLEKYNRSGTRLWRSSGKSMSSQTLRYVSADNTKLVTGIDYHTGTSSYLDVYDNNTGAFLYTLSGTYVGGYMNKIAYISQTYSAGNINWVLRIRDLSTGTEIATPVIKTYKRNPDSWYSEFTTVAPIKSIVSADGKLIFTGGYTHIFVYDMMTGNQEAKLNTYFTTDPVYDDKTNSEDSYSNYTIDDIALTDDGQLRVAYRSTYANCDGCSDRDPDQYNYYIYTINTTTGSANQAYAQYGQTYRAGTDVADVDIAWKQKFNFDPYTDDLSSGMSFRIADNKNMYRVEMTPRKVRLVKVVNGVRSVLKEVSNTFSFMQYYAFDIKARGTQLKVYVSGVPVIDVADSAISSGSYGLYAENAHVLFKDISIAAYDSGDESMELNNVGIVGSSLDYTTTYSDYENDPEITANRQWTFTHTSQKFLNAGDGYSGTSAYHGSVVTSPVLTLDKVGLYRIDYQAQDDPAPAGYKHPSAVFADYRKLSNRFTQYVVIHRKPVSAFTVAVAADKTVTWTDTSYDPDRWLSAANYSSEATGINYQTTRGIVERKYYFITPSGNMVNQKLVTPTETGTYTVALAVKDEYGAWSDWTERTIAIAATVTPNQPPVAGFTVSPASGYRGTNFTVVSTASDPEDGAAANLAHEYYIRNVSSGGPETLQSTNRAAWTKVFDSLGVMEIRQVVTDSKGVAGQAIRSITVLNRAPVADFDWTPDAVWEGDTVQFHNRSGDPDGDNLTYNWRITNAGGQVIYRADTEHTAYRYALPGAYEVRLSVSDGIAQSVKDAWITVSPLGLEPDVRHTPNWLAYHEQQGHETAEHPKDFYSGEQFMLTAAGSHTAIAEVEAWIDTFGIDGERLFIATALQPTGQPGRFAGTLYDPALSSLTKGLPKGGHHIRFRMTYANGIVLTQSIPITIIGPVQGTVNVHRRH